MNDKIFPNLKIHKYKSSNSYNKMLKTKVLTILLYSSLSEQ